MIRHFYICDDLDDLDRLEKELEEEGVFRPQIHVLSNDDTGVETHKHLHNIEAVLKFDVVRGVSVGAIVGFMLAAAVLVVSSYLSLPDKFTWVPFIFLAIVVLGFSTWWGGFHGIQTPHKDFRRFQKDLDEGKHILIVDADSEQETILDNAVSNHPKLQVAGTGYATPRWVVMGQQLFKEVTSKTFP
jgi:hypothetical protein